MSIKMNSLEKANLEEIYKDHIIIDATIRKMADYNTKEIFNDLPVRSRNQVIEVVLDEDFWKIMLLKGKKVKILIDKKDIPEI